MAWCFAARAADLAEGGAVGLILQGREIALFRVSDLFYATSNVCTHEFALLSDGLVEGDCVECPMHQARFHIPSGAPLSAPATEPIATYPVKIAGDDVFIDITGED